MRETIGLPVSDQLVLSSPASSHRSRSSSQTSGSSHDPKARISAVAIVSAGSFKRRRHARARHTSGVSSSPARVIFMGTRRSRSALAMACT